MTTPTTPEPAGYDYVISKSKRQREVKTNILMMYKSCDRDVKKMNGAFTLWIFVKNVYVPDFFVKVIFNKILVYYDKLHRFTFLSSNLMTRYLSTITYH